MALTALDIKDKKFHTRFRGYSEQEVNRFLDQVVDSFEELTKENRDLEAKIQNYEEKLVYYEEMKDSLSQSVILAQETAEKVKFSANTQATNLLSKANYDANQLIDEAKNRASEILRDATDQAKSIAIETEALKRQSRVFHQRLMSTLEGQLNMINSQEWNDLLEPTAVYLQNSDEAFREVVEKVLDEKAGTPGVEANLTNADINLPTPNQEDSVIKVDATRPFTDTEMEELQRRVEESSRILEETQKIDLGEITAALDAAEANIQTIEATAAPQIDEHIEPQEEPEPAPVPEPVSIQDTTELSASDLAAGLTQTFKLNIQD